MTKACAELEQEPMEDESLRFDNIEQCEYNLHMLILMVLIAGTLTYFPLKVHFTLVIRSYYKE